MANTEDIEARLCAYVDGELDASGRAEIERHLTTNPQHRALISDLVRQRDLLRALPRVGAPIDVAETFNAQLERSALLSEEDWHQPIRISRWPQIRAAAAVLLLVFGLAAVVYYVVPSPNQSHTEIALTRPTVEPTRATEDEDESPATVPTGLVTVSRGLPDSAMTLTEQQQRSMIALSQTFSDAQRRDVMTNAIPLGQQIVVDAFAGGGAATGGAGASAERSELTVVIAAADPSLAQQRVEQYLQNRRIDFEPQVSRAAMKQQLALDPSQVGLQPLRKRVAEQDRVEVEGARIGQVHELAQVREARPFEQPPDRQLDAIQRERVAQPHEEVADAAAPAAEPPQEQTYFARSMTRREVELLCRDISTAAQVAQVVEEKPKSHPRVGAQVAGAAPTTPPADFSVREIDPNQWKVQSLLPFAAQSHADAPGASRGFGLEVPLASNGSQREERVDVLIVVLPDAAPAQKTITQDTPPVHAAPALEPAPGQERPGDADASLEAPATAPAAEPSSP